MTAPSPKIDQRRCEDLITEVKALIPYYVPELRLSDNEAGLALVRIFAHMFEGVIQRLNRVPEKYFTAFLDTLGVSLLPAEAAVAPVTFSLAQGTQEHVFIPAGTQVAAGDVLFETEKHILATPARLLKVFGLDIENDKIYQSPANVITGRAVEPFLSQLLYDAKGGDQEIFLSQTKGLEKGDILCISDEKGDTYVMVDAVFETRISLTHTLENDLHSSDAVRKATTLELFAGKNVQQHILYFGQEDLFNITGEAVFTIHIPNAQSGSALTTPTSIQWEYWGEALSEVGASGNGEDDQKEAIKVVGWHPLRIPHQGNAFEEFQLQRTGWIDRRAQTWSPGEMTEHEINGIKSRWIRGVAVLSETSKLEDVVLDTIRISNITPEGGRRPDMAYFNDVPLDMENLSPEKPIYPLGTRPRQLDTFYIASQEAFSKKNATIAVHFDIAEENAENTPVRKIHGVGSVYVTRLHAADIYTTGDLLLHSTEELADILKTGGSKPMSYYSTKAVNIKEAAQKNFYDKARDSSEEDEEDNDDQNNGEEPILSWEYWNGKGWKVIASLESLVENADFNFFTSGGVAFECPPDIETASVAGQESYWIRVRIVSGDYGTELQYVSDSNSWIPGEGHPPAITRISIAYQVARAGLQHCLTYNNLEFKDFLRESQEEGKTFKPFQRLDDAYQTLYLGFDRRLEKGPISIFTPFADLPPTVIDPPKIEWSYYSRDKKWVRLDVLDTTQNFMQSGTVEFLFPPDFAATSKFGHHVYWIKAVDLGNKIRQPLGIQGLHVNTVLAVQAETVEDEILGSSDGGQNQTYSCIRFPLVREQVWVNEAGTISDEEKKSYVRDNGKDAIHEIIDKAGHITEVWLRWQPVEDFLDSSPNSRHYVVNKPGGEVVFGDGVYGMIPPAGKNNIKASYQVGGGENGTVAIADITDLKASIPFVDRVFNPEAAHGGSDTEPLEAVFERGPQVIKHLDRAVTEEDFARLAVSASGYVARSKCFVKENTIRIIIIPKGEAEKPMPSLELIKTVEKHIHKRSLTLVPAHCIRVQEPSYVEVSVVAEIVPESIELAVPLEKEILSLLKAFFHPLTGGHEKTGWEFGRDVHISDVYALLEGIDGVNYVKKLELRPADDTPAQVKDIMIEAFETVCSGEHRIIMRFGG